MLEAVMAERVTDRETLLSAADGLVNDGGEAQLTIRALASACHISPSTVYNYFGSREDLIAELCHRYLDDLSATSGTDAERAGWADFLSWASRQKHRAELVLAQMEDRGNDGWPQLFERAFHSDPLDDPDRAAFVLAVSRLVLPQADGPSDPSTMRALLDSWLSRISSWSTT